MKSARSFHWELKACSIPPVTCKGVRSFISGIDERSSAGRLPIPEGNLDQLQVGANSWSTLLTACRAVTPAILSQVVVKHSETGANDGLLVFAKGRSDANAGPELLAIVVRRAQ